MCSYRSKAIIRLTKALVQLILNAKDQQKKKPENWRPPFPLNTMIKVYQKLPI